MKTFRSLIPLLILVMILTSCVASTSAPSPTLAPAASTPLPPTPSSTALPTAHVTDYTQLFTGPGNFDYDQLGWLLPPTQVDLLGTFGDFIKVDAALDSKSVTGYIHNTSLDALPKDLPQLQVSDVPPIVIDTTTNFFGNSNVTLSDSSITINNDNDKFYNPPQQIDLASGFTLTFGLTTVNSNYDVVKLTDKPENPAGIPYWKDIHRMNLYVDPNSNVWVMELHDGTSENNYQAFSLDVPGNLPIALSFDDPVGKVIVAMDRDSGHIYKKIDTSAFTSITFPNGLFPEGHFYLSVNNLDPQSTMTIKDLSATKPPTGAWTDIGQRLPILPLAQKFGIMLGNEMDNTDMVNPREIEILRSNFNKVSTGEFTWPGFWLSPDQFDFTQSDQEINWALSHGFQVQVAPLIRGDTMLLPDWLVNGKFSRDQLIEIMQKRIRMIMNHYKGKVKEWSVVNEIVNRGCDPQYSWYDFWCKHIGPDYPEIALRTAREVDPNAILIWSEDDNECPSTSRKKYMIDTEYSMIQDMKSRGVPLDVVAMQMHLFTGADVRPIPPSKQCVIDTMKKFASLGVSIYVSEMDINLNEVPGTQQQRLQFEAQIYHDMMSACIESGVCKSFSVWGPADATTWLNCSWPWCYKYPKADPLLFDDNYQPKPAYQSIYNALFGK